MTHLIVALVLGGLSVDVDPELVPAGSAATVRIHVSSENGAPTSDAEVRLSSSLGVISAPQRIASGEFEAHFSAPRTTTAQVALVLVEATLKGERLHAWTPIRVGIPAELKMETGPYATVTLSVGPGTVGPVIADGRGRVALTALAPPGVTKGQVRVRLRSGKESKQTLDLPSRAFPMVRALEDSVTVDPATPAELEIFAVTPQGMGLEETKPLHPSCLKCEWTLLPRGGGRFVLRYRAKAAVPDEDEITLAMDGSSTAAHIRARISPRLEKLPPRLSAGLWLGAGISVQTNFNKAQALVPSVSFSWGPRQRRFEVLATFEAGFYRSFSGAWAGVTGIAPPPETTGVHAFTGMAGGRYLVPIMNGLGIYVAALAGVTAATAKAPNVTATDIAPALRATAGVTVELGPGRFLGELQGTSQYLSQSSVTPYHLQGQFGGLGLAVAYQFRL